jgi:ankyrin repeat protein
MAAAFGGSLTVVQALVAEGADVNAKSKMGVSALKNANTRGFTLVAKALEDAGAVDDSGGKKGKKKKRKKRK